MYVAYGAADAYGVGSPAYGGTVFMFTEVACGAPSTSRAQCSSLSVRD
jgi:hypothetical protein